MIGRVPGTRATVAFLLLVGFVSSATAENVEKKFRISLAVGGHNARDEVESDSANELLFTDRNERPTQIIFDPRNDSAVFSQLKIEPATRATLSAQYAVNKILLIEASVGYQKGDVGDIEVQAQFNQVRVPEEEDFNFAVFRFPAGEMTQVPIQLTALARFRPRAKFNPYFGGGVGYIVVGFDPSPELNELSRNMDNSIGGFAVLESGPGFASLGTPDSIVDLQGAEVDARDSFEWHVVGGAELSFRKKWVLFLDLRYMFASRTMSIGFNGSDSLGVSVPDGILFEDDPLPPTGFGAVAITRGGLVDGGQLVPSPTAPPNTDCSVTPFNCEFVFLPDGQLDTGLYYVQGGSIEYDGISAQLGVRYTF